MIKEDITMSKTQNVIEFYMLCNKLKNIVRTGWLDWGVDRKCVESIAEHVYGTQMLAISMWSEFGYNIDIKKVLTMLAVHELEETVIGDLTMFQIDKKTKAEMGHKAVKEILSKLSGGATFEELVLEFDERKTPEAQFAYQCDKLECDIQSKIYDEDILQISLFFSLD
jgi:putative hydrolase of HD superfamily